MVSLPETASSKATTPADRDNELGGAGSKPDSLAVLESRSSTSNSGQHQRLTKEWLDGAAQTIERTNELINSKETQEAVKMLLELDSVFEANGVVGPLQPAGDGSTSRPQQYDSTNNTSPIAGSPGELAFGVPGSLKGVSKISIQLAIITKYNLACCYQSIGEINAKDKNKDMSSS